MNAMVVPEGTYEVCSRTITTNEPQTNPKWILNVTWKMQGTILGAVECNCRIETVTDMCSTRKYSSEILNHMLQNLEKCFYDTEQLTKDIVKTFPFYAKS